MKNKETASLREAEYGTSINSIHLEGEELQMHVDELEVQWRKSLPKYSEKELVEVFKPSVSMLKAKIREWNDEREVATSYVKKSLQGIYAMKADDFSTWFGETLVKIFLFPDVEKCNKHISRLNRMLLILMPDRSSARQDELERARQYPIYESAKGRLLLRQCGNKYSALCPFHEERHASFYIYSETNSYYCFGCQSSGDVISLTVQLYGISFREAVKMLQ